MPDPIIPTEEQIPSEETPGIISGIERNDYVDQKLRDYGVDPEEITPTEESAGEEDLSEAEKTILEAKKKEESQQVELQRADAEKKAKEEADQVTAESAKKQIEKETGKKEDEETYPWEVENREPTQREVLDYIAQKADHLRDEREQEKIKAESAQKADEAQKQADYRKAWETEWARQLDSLEKAGHISPIKDQNDKNDQGLVDRARIWEEAVKNNAMNLTEVYLLHILPGKGKQSPGASAPISRGDAADYSSEESNDEFFYDEIHGKDVDSEAAKIKIL